MKPHLALLILMICSALGATAQNDRAIEEQKRIIASLEQKIANEEREITKIQQGRNATQERATRLARQIESRTQLLEANEKEALLLRNELTHTEQRAGKLTRDLDANQEQYAEMAREAYRNYRHHNYLTYLFSARDFKDIARKLSNLREMALMRERKLTEITNQSELVRKEQEELDRRKAALDAAQRRVTTQRSNLQRDANTARANIRQMSQKEKRILQQKVAKEQQLSVAISELRKLTKGNTEGASFSTNTSGLRLPVQGGRVKRYKENMAEVVGPRGAQVISIYDGKVVEIKRNRITDKYDVFVAHGEYITSYANLGTICVEKEQKVAKNATLGTIGAAVDVMTMETEYKLIFGIYPPNPTERMRAENCFKR